LLLPSHLISSHPILVLHPRLPSSFFPHNLRQPFFSSSFLFLSSSLLLLLFLHLVVALLYSLPCSSSTYSTSLSSLPLLISPSFPRSFFPPENYPDT
jgi:hypothetical protein